MITWSQYVHPNLIHQSSQYESIAADTHSTVVSSRKLTVSLFLVVLLFEWGGCVYHDVVRLCFSGGGSVVDEERQLWDTVSEETNHKVSTDADGNIFVLWQSALFTTLWHTDTTTDKVIWYSKYSSCFLETFGQMQVTNCK